MPTAGVVYVDVRGDTVKFSSDIDAAARQAERSLAGITARGARNVLNDLGGVATAAARGVALVGGAAIAASTDFNKSMSGVAAVAGATAQEMELLRQAAIDAGAATAFGASDAAVAEAELAKAGVAVADILGGALAGSLDLAAAGQLELGNAAEISAQAMNIFNLEGDKVSHIADVMAAGANKSAADVKQLGDALRQGGLVAAQVGLDLEDTVGVLSLFSDNALIGSDAGTSLKTMLQRLAPQSKEAAKAMEAVGLEFFNAEGEFVGIEEAAQRLQNSFAGLSEEQRLTEMTTIFGADAIRAANLLYQAGADGVREYVDAVDDQGAAQRMAAEQLNNLAGDVEEFSGSAETALISLGNVMDPVLRSLTQGGTDTLNVFNEFATTPAFSAIEDNIAQLGDIGAGVFEDMADAFAEMLGGITAADINAFFYKASNGAEELAESMEGLEGLAVGVSAALASMGARSVLGPFAGIVPHIGLVTGAIAGLLLGSEEGRAALTDLGAAVTQAGVNAMPSLTAALQQVVPPLTDLLVSGIELASVVLPDIINAAAGVAEVAGPTLGAALEAAADVIGFVADNADYAVPALAGLATVLAGMKLNAFITSAGGVAAAIKTIGTSAATAAGAGGLANLGAFLSGPFGIAALGAGVAVGGLTKHFLDNKREASEAAANAKAFAAAIAEAGNVADGVSNQLENVFTAGLENEDQAVLDLRDAMQELGIEVVDLSDLMISGGQGLDDVREQMGALARDTKAAEEGYNNFAAAKERQIELVEKGIARSADESNELSNLNKVLDESEDAYGRVTGKVDELAQGQTDGIELERARAQVTRESRTETERLAAALDGLTAAQERNAGKQKSLTDLQLDARDAMEEWKAANEAASGSMDINTEKGRDNFEAARNLVTVLQDQALAQLAVDGNTKNATAALSGIADMVRQFGAEGKMTTEQVDALLVELGLVDEADIAAKVNKQQVDETLTRTEELQESLDELGGAEANPKIQALIDQKRFDEAEQELRKLQRDRVAKIEVRVEDRLQGGYYRTSYPAAPQANGGLYVDQPTIAKAGAHLYSWAEPETGGEAFIPFAPSKRDKSIDIWAQAGKHLGVMPMAEGGISAAQELRNQQLRNQLEFIVELKADQGDIGFFQGLAAKSIAWSDDWKRWLDQINDLRQKAADDANRQRAEQKQNMIEYKAARVEGTEAIKFFRQQRDQFTPWTNEWVKWTQRLESAEEKLAEKRREAAEEVKKQREEAARAKARAEAERLSARENAPTITIENVNVTQGVSLAQQIENARLLLEPVPVA